MAYEYIGDINLEYGGIYIDISDWKDGYANAVEICDLDSGCGFTGAVYIRALTLLKPKTPEMLKSVLSCVGEENENPSPLDLAYASFSYGYYDADEYPPTETIQLESDGDMDFDGWKANFKADEKFNLRDYVENTYLK